MEIGVHQASFTFPGWETSLTEQVVATAQAAEAGGAELFTVMDHWFQMENLGGPSEPMLEAYTTLAHVAALTSRIRLSVLVTGGTYRHPGLLAKTVTTLDRLSGGRALLGLGAGWYEREHVGLGVPFPPTAERFERLEESLRICLQMWGPDEGPFAGEHYQLAETVCVPPPLARPHPPIMIGGAGEQKTLRFVARYAQWCNIFGSSPELMQHKLEVLRGHCATEGTDYDAIRKTMIVATDPLADPDAFVTEMASYAALGITLVTLTPRGDDPAAWTEQVCAEVLPRLQAL
ncbi:LLM class F420-dependent oxidoreductase [Nocardioides stalactiti]|uniref:LLM class F420-dependent oxidoreductase n=1 Tax=Nocardioides stalactiti TaxID=2755356 RepID=UPI001601058C|nr:LLM class F420-dependent oxidoreductase [Nocardioides stalactiti]